jgi:hypothetical protein
MIRLSRTEVVIASVSEAIQESSGALRPLDRHVAIARPEGRASLDALWLLAMTIPSRCNVL